MKRIVYPETHRDETAFTIGPNNVKIPDPYRWLEDPNSAETQVTKILFLCVKKISDRIPFFEAWVESQNTITNKFLEEIPFREKIKQRYFILCNDIVLFIIQIPC
jgi:prolyl oligopeptidase